MGNNKPHPMVQTHWGDRSNTPGQQQGRHPKAPGPSPATLHWGPWQKSPRAMEAAGDRQTGTQSRRRSPAKQRDSATQATGVRRWWHRVARAITPMVRDTPNRLAAPKNCGPKEEACGPTHGHMWGPPPIRDTWTGWPLHYLPKLLREPHKGDLNYGNERDLTSP